ncbi:hypothetical protein, conserved [Leishmania lindenbergi]|uniref:Uncharacterized protein n=1 Tax=Leishmania lindenbergi TaxID=651832 RepID=A0AAW3A5Q6_9TRYP
MHATSAPVKGGGRERETRHRLGLAISEAYTDVGSSGNTGVAAVAQSSRFLSPSVSPLFSLAPSTGCGTSVSDVVDSCVSSSGVAVHEVEHATVASRRHSHGAQAMSSIPPPLPSRPQGVLDSLQGSAAGGFSPINTRGPLRYHIAYSGSPPQHRTSVLAAAATRPKADAATAEKGAAAFERTDVGPSAFSTGGRRTSLKSPPFVAAAAPSGGATVTRSVLTSGHANSLLLQARAALAKASVARDSVKVDARSDDYNAVPLGEDAHDSRNGLPSSLSQRVEGHEGQGRCEEVGKEEHKSDSGAVPRGESQRTRQATDVYADQPKLSHVPSQLRVEKLLGLAAESAATRRRVGVSAISFDPSSRRALIQDRAAASNPTAITPAIEVFHSRVTSPSRPHFNLPVNCTGHMEAPLCTASDSLKGISVPMPSVRFIYTRSSSSSSNARGSKKSTPLSIPAVKDALGDDVRATAAVSTEPAITTLKVADLADERVTATTTAASTQLSLATQLLLSRSTLSRQHVEGKLRRPSASIPVTLDATCAYARTRTAGPAPQLFSETRDRPTDEKPGEASRRDVEHPVNDALQHTGARDFDEASQSRLQRWRQGQEGNRSKAKYVASINTSTSPTVEGDTTSREMVKNNAGVAPKGDEVKPLPSAPTTVASGQQQERGERGSARGASATTADLVIAPEPPTEEPERQRRRSLPVDAGNTATAPTASESFLLSEAMHSDAAPDSPETELASVDSRRSSKVSMAPRPKLPSIAKSGSVVDECGVAAVRNEEVQASLPDKVSTHAPPHNSPFSCYLTEDPAHRATAEEGAPVDGVSQSLPPPQDSPVSAIDVKPPHPPSTQHKTRPCFAPGVTEGVTPANRQPSNRASTHQSVWRQTTRGSTAAAKEASLPFSSPGVAKARELFRAVLERRGQRLQLQESLNASRVSPQQLASIEARAETSGEGAEVSPAFPRCEQPSARHTTATSSPSTSPWSLMQGATVATLLTAESARSSACASSTVTPGGLSTLYMSSVVSLATGPDTGDDAPRSGDEAAAETSGESVFFAHQGGRDYQSSFPGTEIAAEKADTGLKSSPCSENEELVGSRSVNRKPDAYTFLLQWIRQSRAQSSRPTSGAPTPLPAVDVEVGLAAIPTTTDNEQNARLAERRALVDKYHRPSRTSSDVEVDTNKAQRPELDASRPVSKASFLRKSSDPCCSHQNSSCATSLCTPFFDKDMVSEKHLTSAPAPPSGQDIAESHNTLVDDAEWPPYTPASAVVADADGAPTSTVAALGDIQLHELDKLEQSINALLKNYGPSKAPGKESTPTKMTAAAALMREMPPPARTSTSMKAKHKETVSVLKERRKKDSNCDTPGVSSSEGNTHSWRHHGCASETDDDDSQWEGSGLWCGDEATYEAKPPTVFVPPLDLTPLLLPTNDSEDLKPYRIPLPSAVPAPDEAHRHLLLTIGAYAVAFGAECNTVAAGDDSRAGVWTGGPSASSLMMSGEDAAPSPSDSASFNNSCAPPSCRARRSGASLTGVSPFVNERIQRMRASWQHSSSTVDVTVDVRSRRVSREVSSSVKDGVDRAESKQADVGNASLLEKAAYSKQVEKGGALFSDGSANAQQRAAHIQFTDDSDALDGGRGAERDRRVSHQRARVQRILLDCQEQRRRKGAVVK